MEHQHALVINRNDVVSEPWRSISHKHPHRTDTSQKPVSGQVLVGRLAPTISCQLRTYALDDAPINPKPCSRRVAPDLQICRHSELTAKISRGMPYRRFPTRLS